MEKKEPVLDEQIRYKKKSRTASTSKSGKRADHKHEYAHVIIKSFLGFQWGRRCTICGRVDESYWFQSFQRHTDFMRPESKGKSAIGASDYFSVEEIHHKYPDAQVIEQVGTDYKEI